MYKVINLDVELMRMQHNGLKYELPVCCLCLLGVARKFPKQRR
jgi:hypothetical protein